MHTIHVPRDWDIKEREEVNQVVMLGLELNSGAVGKGEKDERKALQVACSVLRRGLDLWEVMRVIREL